MTVFRMCAVCRERKDKNELLRISRFNGKTRVDFGQNLSGRGMYICKSKSCLLSARKRKVIERALSIQSDDIYEELEKIGDDIDK